MVGKWLALTPTSIMLLAAACCAEHDSSVMAMVDTLPSLTEDVAPVDVDWLVEPVRRRARVYQGAREDEIIMTNGLISRTFRLAPNGATVAFDNLMTGEAILRAVRPEARITLDGSTLDVGGLVGQPDHAYLLPEWLDAMQADPAAMQLVGFHVGEPRERFHWERVRYHAPDVKWPPEGAHLRLDFRPSADAAAALSNMALPASPLGRECLVEDGFAQLDPAWRVHETKAHERSSFSNEGKVGEIYTPGNTAVFAERDLPAGVRLVETQVHPGTDRTASWGPGMALLWPEFLVKINYRPGASQDGSSGNFTVYANGSESLVNHPDGPVSPENAIWLRIRLDGNTAHCEASSDGAAWRLIQAVALPEDLGDPTGVRVGKLSRSGGADDHDPQGELVRLKVMRFAAYSAMDEETIEELARERTRLSGMALSIHYEMYDGIPLIAKWLTLQNGTDEPVRVDSFTSEILAAVEYESLVGPAERQQLPNIHVESDYEFHGDSPVNANEVVNWVPDPEYTTQVNYGLKSPVLLECRPRLGPGVSVAPGEIFESFRVFELAQDSTDRERKGLAVRRMYRTIAPWATENPIMMHSRNSDPDAVKLCIDQCAEVGFEMVILSFGSGFNLESTDPEYRAHIKELADYAHSKGIEIGGYSLLASRSVGPTEDVVDPETGGTDRAFFGHSPCLMSNWGLGYMSAIQSFVEEAGLDLVEHDGSYPGDVCASTEHPGHDGLEDSQWKQWQSIMGFYRWCRARGVYLNVPDWYFLNGSTKSAMGYRETNWSLPRDWQIIHGRQNIYDGTWEKTPSMGWMFIPLVEYQGGGAAATLEPLAERLDAYGAHLAQNFGSGVQACYRGPRLYDTDETKAVVKRWVDFYKKYRDILDSDIIHIRRPDGRHIDAMLHVNPRLEHKGLATVYNPLGEAVETTIKLPLYYTGLTETARVREQDGEWRRYTLSREYEIEVPLKMGPRSATWFVIE